MKAEHEAVVPQAAFAKAAKATFRGRARPKRHTRNFIATDTQIHADGGEPIVETPIMESRIPMTGAWNVRVSVDSKMLALMARHLKPSETTTLSYAAGKVFIDDGLFTLAAEIIERWNWE